MRFSGIQTYDHADPTFDSQNKTKWIAVKAVH